MSNPEVKALPREQVPEVVPLFCSVFNQPPWSDGWTEQAATERLQAMAAHPRYEGVQAWKGGQRVGFALGWAERWTDRWQFHLYEMCVDHTHQRQGVGQALMKGLGQRLQQLGIDVMFLETRTDLPARQFYDALGFQVAPVMVMGKRIG